MSNFARIQILNGTSAGFHELPTGREFTFGRLPENDALIDGSLVSRRHCHIKRVGKRHRLFNTSSTVTLVNGQAVDAINLVNGDVVTIDGTMVRYLSADDEQWYGRLDRETIPGANWRAFIETRPEAVLYGRSAGPYKLCALFESGEKVDTYLGAGAEDEAPVEIRVLRRGKNVTAYEQEYFVQNAKTLAELDHKAILKVVSHGMLEGRPFAASPHRPGKPLNRALDAGERLDARGALVAGTGVLEGLEHLQTRKLAARDIGPRSLRLLADGKTLISRLGMTATDGSAFNGCESFANADEGARRSRPPEYCREHSKTGHVSDMFALASVMYQAMSGTMPWEIAPRAEGENPRAHCAHTIRIYRNSHPVPLNDRVKGLDSKLWPALQLALEVRPQNRYKSLEQFRIALERVLAGLPA